MAKLESLSEVSVFTNDLKRARDFYTKKLGLTVRQWIPKMKYLVLGATKGGDDAGLSVWQPEASWGPDWETYRNSIGEVTGIGFATADLDRTATQLTKRGVEVGEMESEEEGGMRTVRDPDGNTFFVFPDQRPKAKRAGLSRLEFVTIAAKDAGALGAFYENELGMKGRKIPGDMRVYRLSPKGTSLMPFTPTREFYKDAGDYDADMAHVGERTGIGFSAKDLYGLQEQLLSKGVRFSQKAERKEWGGISADILDPSDNVYSIYEWTPPKKGARKA